MRTRVRAFASALSPPLHAGSAAPPTNKKHVRAYYPVPSAASESLRDPYCMYIHMHLTAISAAHLSYLAYGVGVATITMSTDSPACPRSVGGLKVFKNVVHTMKGMWMT